MTRHAAAERPGRCASDSGRPSWTFSSSLSSSRSPSPCLSPPSPPSLRRPASPGRAARAALELPPEAWADVHSGGRLPARPLGYTLEEMKNFGRDRLVMRPVENLFRNARASLRTSGRVTDELLAAAFVLLDTLDRDYQAYGAALELS